MKGRLKDRPLEILLHDIPLRSPTGVLTLERGPAKKQVCFLKGVVRFAASNLREDRLAEYLIRIDAAPPDVIHGLEAGLEPGQRLGDALLNGGYIPIDALREAVRANTLDIVIPCFEWRHGEYRFEAGVPNIVGEIPVDISILEINVERARRRAATTADALKLLPSGDHRLSLGVPTLRDIPKFPLTPAESLVLARAEEGETLAALLSVAPAMKADLARTIWALLESGLVSALARPAAGAADVTTTLPPGMKKAAAAAAVSEPAAVPAEVRYYKQMHDLLLGADHYKTLGIETTTGTDEVRKAYYALAKEIHPDRFLSPPLDALHHDMEELFAQVLEAYNTLVDEGARARYDAERAAGGIAPKVAAADEKILAKQNFLRGRASFEDGKMAESLKFLMNAVQLDPERPEYLRLLGTVQARNPRLRDAAEATLLKAIELDPARGDGYLQLGLLYRRIGNTELAIERLRDCLKWDPTNAEAGTALAEMTRTVGERG